MNKLLVVMLSSMLACGGLFAAEKDSSWGDVAGEAATVAGKAATKAGKAVAGSVVPVVNNSHKEYPIWVTIKSESTAGRILSKITHLGGAVRYDYKHIKGGGDSYTFTATGNRVVIRTTVCRNGKPTEIEKEHTKSRGYVRLTVTVNPNASSDSQVIVVTES